MRFDEDVNSDVRDTLTSDHTYTHPDYRGVRLWYPFYTEVSNYVYGSQPGRVVGSDYAVPLNQAVVDFLIEANSYVIKVKIEDLFASEVKADEAYMKSCTTVK